MTESEIVDAELVGEDTETEPKIRPGRAVVKFIATSSVRFVVSSAITTLVPVETAKEKRKVFIASMVLSGVINEQVKPYIDQELDELFEFYHDVKNKIQELNSEKNEDDVPNP